MGSSGHRQCHPGSTLWHLFQLSWPFNETIYIFLVGERHLQHAFASLVHGAAFKWDRSERFTAERFTDKIHFYFTNLIRNIVRLTRQMGKKVVIVVTIVTSSQTLCRSVFSGWPWPNFQNKSSLTLTTSPFQMHVTLHRKQHSLVESMWNFRKYFQLVSLRTGLSFPISEMPQVFEELCSRSVLHKAELSASGLQRWTVTVDL